MHSLSNPFWIVVIILANGLGIIRSAPQAPQAAAVDLVSPSACPPSGCAAGQRLNFKVDFSLSPPANPSPQPNLLVCMYAPQQWAATLFELSPPGADSGQPYEYNSAYCEAPPSGFSLLGGALSRFRLPDTTFADSLPFSLRIGKSAASAGSVLVRVLTLNAANQWLRASEASRSIAVAAAASQVYVANDAPSCGQLSPCYLNSLNDQPAGLGTGLKDAVDAALSPAQITVLGNYQIKQNTVFMDQPLTLQGNATSRLSTASPACDQPVLMLAAGVTIKNLSIDDGACANPNRDLLFIADPNADTIVIESNDLVNGEDAIHIGAANKAAVTLRFNQISGNQAYAVFMDAANAGVLDAYANNLSGNRSGAQVDCGGSAKGRADHNFWGAAVLAGQGAAQCSTHDARRLGAAIVHNEAGAGVQAQAVTVQTSTQYVFRSAIGFQRSGAGEDFGLVIVNHGQGHDTNVPFTGGQIGSPFACGNFWDVFLSSATAPVAGAALDLFFRYDLNASCVNLIESPSICGQSANLAVYPLWWYDPDQAAWKTSGATGAQTTTCHTDRKEIQVRIQPNARPDFTDLARLPWVAGLPAQPSSVVFSSLTAQPGITQAQINWVTSSEINISAYAVQRSTQADSGFSDLAVVERKGKGSAGASYQYSDSGLSNNSNYYYRLRMINFDGKETYSQVLTVTLLTATPTRTLTRFPTSTYIYRSPTATRTATPTPTSPFKTITPTPTLIRGSQTGTAAVSDTPLPSRSADDLATVLAVTREVRTSIAVLSATPTPTATPPPRGAAPLTISMAILAVVALAGGAIYLVLEQRAHP